MGNRFIIHNATVINPGTPSFVLEKGAVLVVDDLITQVGPEDTILAANTDARRIDACGRVVMPGLINAHMHLYSTFACGLACEPAHNFPEILARLWWKLDRALSLDDVEASALVPLHRSIVSGTTTVIDHHASPYAVKGSLRRLAESCRAAGLRACLCYETSDRDGNDIRQQGIAENMDFARWTVENPSSMTKALMGLHASMTLSDKTLAETSAACRDLRIGAHVHAAEDTSDQKHCLANHGIRVIERFERAGLLGPTSILGHCIHVNESERRILKDTETFVAHNPESNMNNAVGCADVIGMLQQGIHVGLGTDGMTSDMRLEARTAMLLQRHHRCDPTVGFGEAVHMLVNENARFASRIFGVRLGVIEPGAKADIIIVEHYPFTNITVDNWYGHFLFGVQPSRITHTFVDGEMLMDDGKVLTLDLQKAAGRARQLSPETWERFRAMV